MRVTHPHHMIDQTRIVVDDCGAESAVGPNHRSSQHAPTVCRLSASHRMNRRAATCSRRRGLFVRAVVWVVLGVALLSVAAADSTPTEATVVVAQQVTTVSDLFTNIRNWLVGILAGLATVFLTIGGVRYLMAGGDPGEVEKAKQAFKSAGWGYGLAALAPVIVEILKGIVGV